MARAVPLNASQCAAPLSIVGFSGEARRLRVATAQYYIEIGNSYLGKYRRVTGRTRREVELRAAEQLQRWSEQEARARHRDAVTDAKESARQATEEAQALLADYRTVLAGTLDVDDRLDWISMRDDRKFGDGKPELSEVRRNLGVPAERKMVERLRPKRRIEREEAEQRAADRHAEAVDEWQRRRDLFEESRRRRNDEVAAFRREYEAGSREAVERYVSLVLAASALPDGLDRECALSYSALDRTLVIEAKVPSVRDMPMTVEYRYVTSRDEVDVKNLKEKDVAELFEDVMLQLALRTLHEVFEGDYSGHCEVVVYNAVVGDIDRATGKDFEACILSLQAVREEFAEIDLRRVDPKGVLPCAEGGIGRAALSDATGPTDPCSRHGGPPVH